MIASGLFFGSRSLESRACIVLRVVGNLADHEIVRADLLRSDLAAGKHQLETLAGKRVVIELLAGIHNRTTSSVAIVFILDRGHNTGDRCLDGGLIGRFGTKRFLQRRICRDESLRIFRLLLSEGRRFERSRGDRSAGRQREGHCERGCRTIGAGETSENHTCTPKSGKGA